MRKKKAGVVLDYVPHPVDLSGVELSGQLARDIERIAENIHETWALQRVRAGWVYGEKNDSEKKTHSGLVEYDRLPESEKDVDRATVTQTIKMLLWLGYRIEPRED